MTLPNPQSKDASGTNTYTLAGKVDAQGTFAGSHLSYGTVGVDWSANPLPVPAIAGWSHLKSVPANANRAAIGMQNLSAGVIQVVVSDGLGGPPTSFLITPSALQQGGLYPGNGWDSLTDKGQVDFWGPPGSPVSIRET